MLILNTAKKLLQSITIYTKFNRFFSNDYSWFCWVNAKRLCHF